MSVAATKKKVTKPALHPPYVDMTVAAIAALKERKGSSKIAIGKYITANYKLGGDLNSVALKKALKTGVAKAILIQVKGTGASGSFKVAAKKSEKKVKAKPKSAKKPAAKKPAAKKPAAKTAKKSASKKKAPTPKKKVATPKKKAVKSPAKKKAPKKKSPKKVAKKAASKKK